MPRPKTISDEAVLSAALKVMARRGTAFTLSDVAKAVELSRATLIQRFGDRETFLRRMAEHEVEQTRAWLECERRSHLCSRVAGHVGFEPRTPRGDPDTAIRELLSFPCLERRGSHLRPELVDRSQSLSHCIY